MPQRKVDSGWSAGVVADGDDLLKPQGPDNRFEVTDLLFEAVEGALRLV